MGRTLHVTAGHLPRNIIMAQKFLIEMVLPDDCDTDDILGRMQEIAVDICEEFPAYDDDGEECEMDENAKEAIRGDVSVQPVNAEDEQEKAA